MQTQTFSPDSSQTRFDNIDLMEFIGIFFVIIYHSQLINNNILKNPSEITYIHYMLAPLMSSCVPLFLFANGFLLSGKELNIRKHVYKIIQLVILTFVWGALNLLFMMLIRGEWMNVKEFIKALWGWKQGWIHHMWYMGALVCVYLIFPLIKAACDHHRKAFNFFLIICLILTFGNKLLCMIATIMYHFLFGGDTYLAFNFFNMFNPFRNLFGFAFSYFCLGCFARMNMERIKTIIQNVSLHQRIIALTGLIVTACILSGLWGIFASRLTHQIWDPVMDSYDSVFTAVIVIAVFLLLINYRSSRLAGRFIRAVSCNTLGIYLMHEIFLHLFRKAGINNLPFMSYIIPGIIYSFMILCLCLAITQVLKEIPFLRNLTGWAPKDQSHFRSLLAHK